MEVDNLTMINAKLDALSKRMNQMNINVMSTSDLFSSCELCQGNHPTIEC